LVKKKYYKGIRRNKEDFYLEECAFFQSDSHQPFIGKLIELWEETDGTKMVKAKWYCRESDTVLEPGTVSPQELLATNEEDSNEISTIIRKIYIVEQPNELLMGDALYFFCNRIYSVATGQVTPLTTSRKKNKLKNQLRKSKKAKKQLTNDPFGPYHTSWPNLEHPSNSLLIYHKKTRKYKIDHTKSKLDLGSLTYKLKLWKQSSKNTHQIFPFQKKNENAPIKFMPFLKRNLCKTQPAKKIYTKNTYKTSQYNTRFTVNV